MAGKIAAQRARGDSRGPHLARRLDATGSAVGVLDRDAVAVNVGDHGTELDFDAHLLQPCGGLLAEVLAHRGQDGGGRVEQNDARFRRIDMAVGAFEGEVREFGDLAGHFDAGRSRAHDGERQELLPPLRIARPLGRLERAHDATAQLQRVVDGLHAGREFGEMVVAEVRLAGPRSDDQAVIRGFVTVAEQLRDDEFALQVDVRDIAEQNLNVVLTPQDHPRWRSDRAFGDDAGRHLVEHRLEQVMGGTSDQLDVDIGPFELLDRVQTTESGSDDYNPVSTIESGNFGLGVHGVVAPQRRLRSPLR